MSSQCTKRSKFSANRCNCLDDHEGPCSFELGDSLINAFIDGLKTGQRVRERIRDRHGHRTRRRYGTVIHIDKTHLTTVVDVFWDDEHVGCQPAENLKATKVKR